MLQSLTLFPLSSPRLLCGLLVLALALSLPAPAAAQTLTVQNGGTVEVSNGGTWDLQGTTVDLGGTGSTASISEASGGRFSNGQLTAIRALSNPSSADPAGLGVQITASVDLGDVTVTRGHTVQTAPNGNASIGRYYDVSPSQNNGGLSAELTLTYNDAELNGLTESELAFFKSTDGGSTWSEEGFDSRDTGANAVTLGGIASLSRWTLGSAQSPLPVDLVGFEGNVLGGSARLTWQTASETNNAGFEVQRQKEKEGWTQIGYVESKAQGGTTTETTSYSYSATDLPVGTHRFRLRQVDLDGTSALTDPVAVQIQMKEAMTFPAPTPNPASTTATLSFAVKERGETTIRLYNTLGQQVTTVYSGTPPAEEQQVAQVDVSGLSSGRYYLRLQTETQTQTRQLTVVH